MGVLKELTDIVRDGAVRWEDVMHLFEVAGKVVEKYEKGEIVEVKK